jgi:methylated-DNA-protein-cysteine methyltransferase-like protein
MTEHEHDQHFYAKVYAVVRLIPRGKVTSYGRIAAMLDAPNAARAVGYALNALGYYEDDPAYADIPWQRVINSQGYISISNARHAADHQAELLRAEGVEVGEELRVDLKKYLWEGLHWAEIKAILGSE